LKRSRSRPTLVVTAQRRAARIISLRVRGHSRLARPGEDIVCAGVSALVQSAAYGVARHARANAAVQDDPDGDYVLELLDARNECAQVVLETALSGLRAIAREYPRQLRVLVRTAAPQRPRRAHRGAPQPH
jgi:uncharacterized protein YsxB (DUF464 family)